MDSPVGYKLCHFRKKFEAVQENKIHKSVIHEVFIQKKNYNNNNKNFQDISTWRLFSIGKQAQTRDDKSRMVMMIALVLFFFFFLFFSKSQDNNAGANPRKLFHCWDSTKHIHIPKPDVPRSFDDNTEFIR